MLSSFLLMIGYVLAQGFKIFKKDTVKKEPEKPLGKEKKCKEI